MDYLGATGTQLSYNAFAYCENDVVNMVDNMGLIPFGFGVPEEIDRKVPKCNGKYMALKKSTKYKNVATYLSIRLSKVNHQAYLYNGYKIMQKGTAIYIYYLLRANSYFRSRAIEVYKFMTFIDWMVYVSYENRNVITRFKNKFIRKFFKTDKMYEDFMDSLSNVALPLVTQYISTVPEFTSLCIEIAEELLNIYYKYLSKEIKYLKAVLHTVEKKHKAKNYNIYIPMRIFYDREVVKLYGTKTSIKWQRLNTVY